MTALFPPLPEETRKLLDGLPALVDRVFPMPGRFRAGLGQDVAELSRLLTSERGERGASYLGKPALLSAYLRYFLPWNVYRLARLFSTLPLNLKAHDAINDFGAGPLTLALSLWISRPDLRELPLEFRCVDRTPSALEAGKKIFSALVLPRGTDVFPWTIKTIRGEIRRNGTLSVEVKGKPAALSAAVNVYNELFWDMSPRDTERLELFAENHARLLSSLTESSGSVLAVEPGIPRSGEFISLLRAGLFKEGRVPLSPCTHQNRCPLTGNRYEPGGKVKWCHFAFDTEDAPEELHRLSVAARRPKERAVLSFILAGRVPDARESRETQKGKSDAHGVEEARARKPRAEKIRVISDPFPVGNLGSDEPRRGGNTAFEPRRGTAAGNNASSVGKAGRPPEHSWGRYACGEPGLVLVTGSRKAIEMSLSGALEELPLKTGAKDAKSGAFIAVKK